MDSHQFNEIIARLERIEKAIAPPKEERGYLNVKEASKMLHVSKRTFQKWRDEGKISYSQIGKKLYFKVADIEQMMKQQRKDRVIKFLNK